MVDFIVVGSGLGGIAFCEQLIQHQCSFVVYDDHSQQSSNVAGGMYNPVILKRFTGVWKASEQLSLLEPFYEALEQKLQVRLKYPLPIYRRFFSVEEQNLWFEATDKPNLQAYLSPNLIKEKIDGVDSGFGFGEVRHTGRIDTNLLQQSYLDYLDRMNYLSQQRFDYTKLIIEKDRVRYNGIVAKSIVFCEGFGLRSNPYFNYLPLNGTKGELLEIEVPGLELGIILKASVFMLPLGDCKYKVGATYKWKDKTNLPTQESRVELETKLQSFLHLPYKVLNHLAGIRPTVTDRHPLVGAHPRHKNLFVLNGLGSRGVMIAPYVAPQLLNHVLHQVPLEAEISIDRFVKLFEKSSSLQ